MVAATHSTALAKVLLVDDTPANLIALRAVLEPTAPGRGTLGRRGGRTGVAGVVRGGAPRRPDAGDGWIRGRPAPAQDGDGSRGAHHLSHGHSPGGQARARRVRGRGRRLRHEALRPGDPPRPRAGVRRPFPAARAAAPRTGGRADPGAGRGAGAPPRAPRARARRATGCRGREPDEGRVSRRGLSRAPHGR